MPTDIEMFLALLVMAFFTYVTRAAGVFSFSLTTITPRQERALYFLSVSVIAALVAPSVAGGDPSRGLGVAAACLTMVATRRALFSLTLGVATTVMLRSIEGS